VAPSEPAIACRRERKSTAIVRGLYFRAVHVLRLLIASSLGISALWGCGSDESKVPSKDQVEEQFFQGGPIGFRQPNVGVEVTTNADDFATMSQGWWSPEDDRARAVQDSLEVIKASGFEAGTALRYLATDNKPQFVFGAVMAVDDAEKASAAVADRVKAMSTRACPWACVKQSGPLKLPADGGAVGYRVLREVRPGGTPESAVDQWQVYTTWTTGDYVHLALLIDDAKGSNVDAFTSFIADEARRTAAL